MIRRLPALAAALLLGGLLHVAPAAAQVQSPLAGPVSGTPTNPVPVPSRADELELEKALTNGRLAGRITIPDQQAASLIQPGGRDWTTFHNVTLAWIGGVAVLGMLGILVLFYATQGRVKIDGGRSGRTLERFNFLERTAHWMTASTFVVLAISGLNLTFGRHLLLPLIGPEAFTAVSQWGKYAHNFLAFPFTLGVVLLFLIWVKDNIPNRTDLAWMKAGGGFLSHSHPPAGRFNGGQKMIFWITVIGGGLVAASGYFLIFPFFATDIAGMQLAHMIHGALSVLMIAVMLAHIYIGSVGMEGAFDAMGSGQVDLNWAKEHHSLWVEQEMAKGRGAVPPNDARAAGAD